MNTKAFYDNVRETLFKGSLTQGVVDTLNTILTACEKNGISDKRQIAYVLATAKHESYHELWNPEWLPVREGWGTTDKSAIAAVTSLFNQKRISVNYALPFKNGLSYFGRGYAQITHYANYLIVGKRIGIDLANHPEYALRRDVAADIITVSMREGLFTGRKLSDYINSKLLDYKNARRIINGTDAADRISALAITFYNSLVFK